MSSGICIFADHRDSALEPAVAELVTAAREIQSVTGEPILALLAAEELAPLITALEALPLDAIWAVETRGLSLFSDDAVSQVAAQMLERMDPSCVLIPASPVGRSLFPRVAVRRGTGLTADCTRLVADRRGDSFYIRQDKPSYGESVMVSIVHREGAMPQMMTVRPGVYRPCAEAPAKKPILRLVDDIPLPESGIRLLEELPAAGEEGGLTAAEVVVVGGRGALENGNLQLLQTFAEKLGAAFGGTRPLADTGRIPFESQIGQTGCTIRPKICISCGVSGAIQHTEGIKDTKLYIAVNPDENAPIFGFADYGVAADMKEILESAIALLEERQRSE